MGISRMRPKRFDNVGGVCKFCEHDSFLTKKQKRTQRCKDYAEKSKSAIPPTLGSHVSPEESF
jgi:hypothetical protein